MKPSDRLRRLDSAENTLRKAIKMYKNASRDVRQLNALTLANIDFARKNIEREEDAKAKQAAKKRAQKAKLEAKSKRKSKKKAKRDDDVVKMKIETVSDPPETGTVVEAQPDEGADDDDDGNTMAEDIAAAQEEAIESAEQAQS